MANVDSPRGFIQRATKHGGPPRITKYKSDGSAIIYPGDIIKKDGSGRGLTITSAADNPVAVAANYAAAVAGKEFDVYDDLENTIFETQADGSDISDDTQIGNFFDIAITTGDTVTKQSKHELDSSASAEDTLILVGLVDRPDNAWGAQAKVLVQFRVDANATVIATT